MGANTRIYVNVQIADTKWIEVSAVTLAEAISIAEEERGVISVLKAQYEQPIEVLSSVEA